VIWFGQTYNKYIFHAVAKTLPRLLFSFFMFGHILIFRVLIPFVDW